ncbi:AurF N-oxygenase family protein [Antrihabitans cavernicola]|uniref:Diiron oxygenase n=1 Tax=Antrihabitans cavernicola TaxID=2495913 RepID=A0A5A7SE33_9NOCA|nr:diiron oxygenase [Spelaeibacter cavernicola]KAA0024420.1 diiron oxygenase [Spelaeibacter cavernicola]
MTATAFSRTNGSDIDSAYADRLVGLSIASVEKNFDPFRDIDWDSPDFAVDPTDTRWILPMADPLGRHSWYKSLPVERQIEIGMWRQAGIAKVGLNFEQLLIRGLIHYVSKLDNQDPEFRYITHEAAEECNHTMMFQEMIDRIGMKDVVGMGSIDMLLAKVITPAVNFFPSFFFTMVLGGEEPIDHLQKSVLRGGEELHPMVLRVMQIHVAEEARHISFAHEYLEKNASDLALVPKFALSVLMPITMRIMVSMIATPPREFRDKFDIPDSVMKELYWSSPESQRTLTDMFADVRALARKSGLINPVSKLVWRACGISGHESRYRSEPSRAAS